MKQWKKVKRLLCEKAGFGMAEVIGAAAMFIVAAFVLIPGLRVFAETLISELHSWFDDVLSSTIFPSN